MKGSKKGAAGAHGMGGLFTFALIGLFAVLSLLLVVYGVRAYRAVADASTQDGAAHTALMYVSNKLRTGDEAGAVSLDDRAGVRLLCIAQQIDGGWYETRIYCQDGALYEQFAAASMQFDPEDGEYLMDADVQMAWAGEGLIELTARVSADKSVSTRVALRARGEAGL